MKFLDPDLLDSTCISTIKAKKFSFTEEKISNESNLILVGSFLLVYKRLQKKLVSRRTRFNGDARRHGMYGENFPSR